MKSWAQSQASPLLAEGVSVFSWCAGHRESGSHAASTRTWCCTIYSLTVSIAVQINNKHSTSCAETLLQPHKAELEGKSIQLGVGGRGGNRGEKKQLMQKKQVLHSSTHLRTQLRVLVQRSASYFLIKKKTASKSFQAATVIRKSFRLHERSNAVT